MAGQGGVGKLARSKSNQIWGVGGEDAHQRRRATVRYTTGGQVVTGSDFGLGEDRGES
jgi:hypothetical protein